MEEHKIRYKFIGDMSVFSEELRGKISRVEELSKNYERLLNIALNYGSRAEMVQAFNLLAAEGKKVISEEDICGALYTSHCPDPDIIVRTGGDIRLSNFLLWQAEYSEFYFTDVLWPDLSNADVDEIVREFYKRKSKYGKIYGENHVKENYYLGCRCHDTDTCAVVFGHISFCRSNVACILRGVL